MQKEMSVVSISLCFFYWEFLYYEIISFQVPLLESPLFDEDTIKEKWRVNFTQYLVILRSHSDQLVPVGLGILSCGPHTLMVLSSETETNMWGYTGFHDTQFTVRVWPWSMANGSSLRICQMYTYKHENKLCPHHYTKSE